ncbi:MAG: hypothetical protein AAB131_00230 [Actinomycetota bacterium]
MGDLAGFAQWKKRTFPNGAGALFRQRERLWDAVVPSLAAADELIVFEFGVAWGYATKWWTSKLAAPRIEWHGFDLFTGLPTNWSRADREVAGVGAFSADGKTPDLDDPRITWHVGDAVASLREMALPTVDRPKFLIFDLDLGAPTYECLETLIPILGPGDVLYFDEAFDAWNERKVIDELLVPNFTLKALGSTATALALQIEARLTQT